ncbi:MAG TPA: NAD(P)H-binding protein [Steroidobacter sp.]|nr:NAD(P)H-binding protein [Steroidobacter sp.]
MKVMLIGASGYVGSTLLAEALRRGHEVTALVRNIGKITPRAGVTPLAVDVLETASLARAMSGHAAVISAFSDHAQTQVHSMRTGKFRLGTDELLVNADGDSYISVEDYAVAMLDELERPAHPRQRFTAGY